MDIKRTCSGVYVTARTFNSYPLERRSIVLTGPEHSRGIPNRISRLFLCSVSAIHSRCVPCGIDPGHESKSVLHEVPGAAGPSLSFHQEARDPADDHPGECVCVAICGLICFEGHFCPAVFDGDDPLVDDDGHLLVLDALADLPEEPNL